MKGGSEPKDVQYHRTHWNANLLSFSFSQAMTAFYRYPVDLFYLRCAFRYTRVICVSLFVMWSHTYSHDQDISCIRIFWRWLLQSECISTAIVTVDVLDTVPNATFRLYKQYWHFAFHHLSKSKHCWCVVCAINVSVCVEWTRQVVGRKCYVFVVYPLVCCYRKRNNFILNKTTARWRLHLVTEFYNYNRRTAVQIFWGQFPSKNLSLNSRDSTRAITTRMSRAIPTQTGSDFHLRSHNEQEKKSPHEDQTRTIRHSKLFIVDSDWFAYFKLLCTFWNFEQ